MDAGEALLQALKEESSNLGCGGTHEAELLSDMLDRIIQRTEILLGRLTADQARW